jgi:hypothetical protein
MMAYFDQRISVRRIDANRSFTLVQRCAAKFEA